MKLMTRLAGSAAICVLALAGPALAQSDYGSGPQYSTPGEQQQTRALNQQATDGTTQSPAVLNGAAPQNGYQQASGQVGPYDSTPGYYGDQTPPSYDQRVNSEQQYDQQYDQQMQQYDQQQQDYQDQRQRYDNDSARYRADLRAYDNARYEWSYPAPVAYDYGDEHRLERLYLIAEPSQQLAQVPVEGPNGRFVGRVRNVDIAPDGRPLRIEVALNRRVSVWVEPGNFRFDPQYHILMTKLTRDDLWQMPGATVESGPM
jgi:hypothetical protein